MSVEPPDTRSTGPFQEFFRTEAVGGALLVVSACAALVVANSGWAGVYHRVLASTIGWSQAGMRCRSPFISGSTMASWRSSFYWSDLEIKREALAGELASPRQAALPIAAAIGGMVGSRLSFIS